MELAYIEQTLQRDAKLCLIVFVKVILGVGTCTRLKNRTDISKQ